MDPNKDDVHSRFKLAQICHLFIIETSSNLDAIKRAVNEILEDDVNINCKITINNGVHSSMDKSDAKDCTLLHFAYCGTLGIDIFNILLERGADYTIKNKNGQTALHLVIKSYFDDIKENSMLNRNGRNAFPEIQIGRCEHQKPDHILCMNLVLSAHVNRQNSVNPQDNDGISHLHGACIANHTEALELFLDSGVSVNSTVKQTATRFAGYTPIHFAVEFYNFEVAQILVRRGAEVNAKTADGMTPLDIAIKHKLDKVDYTIGISKGMYFDIKDERPKKKSLKKILSNEKIIILLLEKNGVSTVGLSNFHLSCTLKDLTITKRLWRQIADINHGVPMISPVFPGYTALHFLAENSIEAVKIFAKRGAKMNVENALGITPLDICVKKYSLQDVSNILSCDEDWNTVLIAHERIKLSDFIKATDALDQFKLVLKNHTKNLAITNDSPILPGSTILHLAVIFSKKKKCDGEDQTKKFDDSIVRECLENGQDVNTQNFQGRTSIHLAFILNKKNIVKLLLEHLNTADEVMNLTDDDGLSYLHLACAMKDEPLVEKLLKNSAPNIAYKGTSILIGLIETGTTPLHVSIACNSHNIVEMLLKHGANLHASDSNGMTPIHWILQISGTRIRGKVVKLIFKALLENVKDHVAGETELSYLHIACYVGHLKAIKSLLDIGSNINAVISYESSAIKRYLSQQQIRLLDFRTCTPLHLAQYRPVIEIITLLMRRGADIFATASKYSIRLIKPLHSPVLLENKDITRLFISLLWDECELQQRMEQRWGLTKLHIACHMKNKKAIRSVLNNKATNINAQVYADSEVFAGCTPLHLLLTISTCYKFEYHYAQRDPLGPLIKLLLDHEADVTIANAKKQTPIHVFNNHVYTDQDRCQDLLLNAHQDFSVNPTDAHGVSHFHLACQWREVEFVEKFLQCRSVDVNQPTDYLSDTGSTALHLVFMCFSRNDDVDWTKLSQTVDHLLKYGANPNAKDSYGDTPLHKPGLRESPDRDALIEKFIRYGADITSKNVRGQSLLDKWEIGSEECASIFTKCGFPINSWNSVTGEGYIAKIYLGQRHKKIEKNVDFKNLVQSSDVRMVDKMGRTVIHNSVAVLPPVNHGAKNYIYAIELFISLGVDINYQDQSGQTALHYAVRMQNEAGVEALLKCGADVNIVDSCGMPSFYYYKEYSKGQITYSGAKIFRLFNFHVRKLQYLRVEVSQVNKNLAAEPLSMGCKILGDTPEEKNPDVVLKKCLNQLEMSKTVDIGTRSLTLFDFLSDTGGVTLYPYIPSSERTIINNSLKSIAPKEFPDIIGITKLQSRKMIMRLELIEPALISSKNLLGFSFPGLCEEIFRFLTNTDLKHIIDCMKFESREKEESA